MKNEVLLSTLFFKRFRDWHIAEQGHSQVTVDNYTKAFRWFSEWAQRSTGKSALHLSDITTDLIRGWLADAEGRGLSKRTRRDVIIAIRSVFACAKDVLEYEGENVGKKVRYPKVHRMEYPKPFTRAEIRAILDLPLPLWDGTEQATKRQPRQGGRWMGRKCPFLPVETPGRSSEED